jgi:hypothetical protein
MMIISYKWDKEYPIPYDINKIMTYLGVTIFSAISFYIPYVRESYTIRILLSGIFLYFIYYNEKKWYLKSSKEK